MNKQHPYIKFEIEHPNSDNSLNLLDFNIKFNNGTTPIFSFYKKSALRNIFLHYNSALPTSMKQNVISNELNRIKNRCSEPEQLLKATNEFKQKLQINNYPINFIKQCNYQKKRKRQHKITSRQTDKIYYFNFPFLSDKIQNKIKRIFKNENLNVRLYDKKQTLRNSLKNFQQQQPKCNKRHCHINSPKLCLRKCCIYQFKCLQCSQIYIGSTTRHLHDRAQ